MDATLGALAAMARPQVVLLLLLLSVLVLVSAAPPEDEFYRRERVATSTAEECTDLCNAQNCISSFFHDGDCDLIWLVE